MSETKSSRREPDAPGITQRQLASGPTLLAEAMPGYHTASLLLRVEGGMCSEPDDQLGLAYVIEQTLDKGTARHDARGLADAFDAIGAHYSISAGRQTWGLAVSALPEFLPRAIELVGETICEPVFPDEAVQTAVSLAQQELVSLEDSPRALLQREMSRRAYGPILGRHPLGNSETLERVTAASVRAHWRRMLRGGAVTVAVAGKFEMTAVEQALESTLAVLPAGGVDQINPRRDLSAGNSHVPKRLEQTQIGISFVGVPFDDPSHATERVLLSVLSGGMSSRLFTEVREKRGLVYWVGAWHEQPRHLGMIHIGAATTPQRCRETYDTVLNEVARLGDDLSEEELERAKTVLVSQSTTTGASVMRRAGDLLTDHFHLGRAYPAQRRIDAVRAVTLDDIRSYLQDHPREPLSVVTVGKEPLTL